MTSAFRLSVLLISALALALATPALSKRKPPPPPPPPPDSAADCSFFVQPSIDDYLVLATLSVGVRCETTKRTISVTAAFTRDGVAVPLIPYDSLTCSSTNVCVIGIDLFSYDNHPIAFPGDQRYCASGSGLVGGRVVGPGSGCEEDARI
jgi:hypothetical protein